MASATLGQKRLVAALVVLILILVAAALLWQRETPPPPPAVKPARSAGAQVFDKWCSDCHSTAQAPGSVPLQRKYQGDPPAILEQRTDLNADYVKAVVRRGISFMPSFRKTEISDAELELLTGYLTRSETGTPSTQPASSDAGK